MEYILNKLAFISSIPQSDLKNWLKDRYGLITGTKYYNIYYAKSIEAKIEHAKKICGIISDVIPPEQMGKVQYGIDNEHKVRDHLEQFLGEHIYELGVVRMSPDSIFACSIDGILENGDIVELKTTGKPTPERAMSDYSEIQLSYRWQMNHNMVCTGAKRCHFYSYSYTSDQYYYRCVEFDEKLWDEMSLRAHVFHTEFIEPIYDLSTRTVREVTLTPINDQYLWSTAMYQDVIYDKPAKRYSQMGCI